jgi:hypothetical protein
MRTVNGNQAIVKDVGSGKIDKAEEDFVQTSVVNATDGEEGLVDGQAEEAVSRPQLPRAPEVNATDGVQGGLVVDGADTPSPHWEVCNGDEDTVTQEVCYAGEIESPSEFRQVAVLSPSELQSFRFPLPESLTQALPTNPPANALIAWDDSACEISESATKRPRL